VFISNRKKRKLTKEEFDNSWNGNKDGFGMSWVEKGKVNYIKGLMTKEAAWEKYDKLTILPHTVHFRFTSTGETVKELTHPFIVGDGSNPLTYKGDMPVLFQNGTLSGWKDWYINLIIAGARMKGKVSDTYVMAQIVERGIKVDADLNIILSSGGKWAIVTKDDIKTFGDFHEEKGVLFSNHVYRSIAKSDHLWSGWNDLRYSGYRSNTNTKKAKYEVGDYIQYRALGELYNGTIKSTSNSDYVINYDVLKDGDTKVTIISEFQIAGLFSKKDKKKDKLLKVSCPKGSEFIVDAYDYVYLMSNNEWDLIGQVSEEDETGNVLAIELTDDLNLGSKIIHCGEKVKLASYKREGASYDSI
jgi:hypothetical protein